MKKLLQKNNLLLFVGLTLTLSLQSCKKDSDGISRSQAYRTLSDYIREKVEDSDKKYIVYSYEDTISKKITLEQDLYGTLVHGENEYAYMIDEESFANLEHPFQIVWINKEDGSIRVNNFRVPLHGEAYWKLINNLYGARPRMGRTNLGDLYQNIWDECFYFKFEDENLLVEHQCARLHGKSEMDVMFVQEGKKVVITEEEIWKDPDTYCNARLQHFGYELKGLGTNYDFLEVEYHFVTGEGGDCVHFFQIPTGGGGSILLHEYLLDPEGE